MKIKGTGTVFLFFFFFSLSLKIDNNTVFNSGSGSKLVQNSGSGFKFNVFGSPTLHGTKYRFCWSLHNGNLTDPSLLPPPLPPALPPSPCLQNLESLQTLFAFSWPGKSLWNRWEGISAKSWQPMVSLPTAGVLYRQYHTSTGQI